MRKHKDMSQLHNLPRARKLAKESHGHLKDHSNQHLVEITWDLNEDTIRDKIFCMRIDGETEIYLDAEEVEHYIRFV